MKTKTRKTLSPFKNNFIYYQNSKPFLVNQKTLRDRLKELYTGEMARSHNITQPPHHIYAVGKITEPRNLIPIGRLELLTIVQESKDIETYKQFHEFLYNSKYQLPEDAAPHDIIRLDIETAYSPEIIPEPNIPILIRKETPKPDNVVTFPNPVQNPYPQQTRKQSSPEQSRVVNLEKYR